MRIRSGKCMMAISGKVSPVPIVEQAIKPFEMQRLSRGIDYTIDYQSNQDDEELHLFTDWNLYKLALFNVLQNAIKYNKINGKIKISV